jgi:phosphatidylglycerol:prolipoprotein diacylglycerol transferase
LYPILFSIGSVHIYTHGLLLVFGAIVGGLIIYSLTLKEKLSTKSLLDNLVFTLLGGIIGARIAYIIFYYNQFIGWKEFFIISYGGLISYGGIIGGLLVFYLILRYQHQRILEWFDLGIPGLMIGWAIGRIGCLLSGDSLGIKTASKIAIWGRVPTQLFESVFSILIGGFLVWLILSRFGKRFNEGSIFLAGLGLYSLGRFIIDFWRDESTLFWFIKPGQLVSVIILIICFGLILVINRQNRFHAWRSDGSFRQY